MIDWWLIGEAVSHYTAAGLKYIEAPWFVSDAAVMVTMPPGRKGHRTQDGPLVGSAEQSFIQLMMNGTLPPGKYVAATPCFRDDEVDELHHRYFMKVELIQVCEPRDLGFEIKIQLHKVVKQALEFFQQHHAGDYQVVETEQGFDIELNGIEIGSYGYREHEQFRWVYGTGLAEPRFSTAARKGVVK